MCAPTGPIFVLTVEVGGSPLVGPFVSPPPPPPSIIAGLVETGASCLGGVTVVSRPSERWSLTVAVNHLVLFGPAAEP